MIGERALCAEIFDEEVDNDRDVDDYIVQSWKNRIFIDKKRVFLPMLYDIDVHAQRKVAAEKEEVEKEVAEEDEERGGEEEAANVDEEPQVVSTSELEKMKKDMFELKDAMLKMNKSMEDGFLRLTNLMSGQDKRLKEVESFVKLQTTYDSHFDPGTTAGYDAGTTPFGGDAVGTPVGGGDAVGTPVGGDDIAVETAVGGDDAGQSEPVKEGEEGEEGDEEDSEEGKKDNKAGEKRKIKPSDAKKHPYTTLTEEKKKRKKAKTTKE